MVDTKSEDGQTFLHYVQSIMSKHMASGEDFLDELAKPAEAFKLSILDIRRDMGQLRTGLKQVSEALRSNFEDSLDNIADDDGYPAKMFKFVRMAESEVATLVDRITLAGESFARVARMYGEDDKGGMNSNEFFSIINQFVASYKRVQAENAFAQRQKAITEKRKAARAAKQEVEVVKKEEATADRNQMDELFAKLREGSQGKSSRRAGKAKRTRDVMSPTSPTSTMGRADLSEQAAGMLAQLKGQGVGCNIPAVPIKHLRGYLC